MDVKSIILLLVTLLACVQLNYGQCTYGNIFPGNLTNQCIGNRFFLFIIFGFSRIINYIFLECGKTYYQPNIRVVGGVQSVYYSWPAQVLIFQNYQGYVYIFGTWYRVTGQKFCGGTIIDAYTIVSAATCVTQQNSFTYSVQLLFNYDNNYGISSVENKIRKLCNIYISDKNNTVNELNSIEQNSNYIIDTTIYKCENFKSTIIHIIISSINRNISIPCMF